MAVDNEVINELGNAGLGVAADNCHVGPIHPEHDPSVTRMPYDPAKAKELMDASGHAILSMSCAHSTQASGKTLVMRSPHSCVTLGSR